MGQTRTEPISEPSTTEGSITKIAETRANLSETINAIEERLSPAHLREQVMDQIDTARGQLRVQVKEEIQELEQTVRTSVRAELVDIKQNVVEEISAVKDVLAKELSEAKVALRTATHDAKNALRAATIGKVETMVQNTSKSMNEAGATIVTTIRENPIPAALIGVGIAWLLMNGTSSGRRMRGRAGELGSGALNRARDLTGDAAIGVRELAQSAGSTASTLAHDASQTVGNLAHGASDKVTHLAHDASATVGSLAHNASQTVGNLAHNASHTVGNLAHQAADTASSLAIQTRDGAYSVEQRFERVLHENPLAVGAAVFAIGTAIGLAIPSTSRENSLMGATRDRLLEKAEHVAHDAVQSAQVSISQVLGVESNQQPQNGQAKAVQNSRAPSNASLA